MGKGRRASEEVTYELRCEGGERTGHGKRLATGSAKALRPEREQHILRMERGRSGWSLEIEEEDRQ